MSATLPRTAADLATRALFTLRPDMPVRDAAGLILREHVSGAPVLTPYGELVGVLSELDLVQALSSGDLQGTVEQHMTRELRTVSPSTTVEELSALFVRHPVRRLLVTEADRLVGLVARRDLLHALARRALVVARGDEARPSA